LSGDRYTPRRSFGGFLAAEEMEIRDFGGCAHIAE
jgi:hypothetical protein